MTAMLKKVHPIARRAFILTAWPLVVANAVAIILPALTR